MDQKSQTRPFVDIYFECCRVYARLYRNVDGTAYAGNCPRCCARLSLPIGPGGTGQRIFRAR